jgi:hypothetical protein
MRFTQDGILRNPIPRIVIVVEATVCDALTVYVPAPPVPVPKAVMIVPAVTPVPVICCPTTIVPDPTAVTVIVVPLIEAVKEVVEADTDVPRTIFAVDDQFVPSVENIVLPAVVGDKDAPVPP